MAAVTIWVILEPKKIKSVTDPLFPHLFSMKWWDQMPWSSFFECGVLSQLLHSPLSLSSRGSSVPLRFLPIRVSSGHWKFSALGRWGSFKLVIRVLIFLCVLLTSPWEFHYLVSTCKTFSMPVKIEDSKSSILFLVSETCPRGKEPGSLSNWLVLGWS